MKEEIYEAKPITENPIIDNIDSATMIAWFRCNSCLTCKWREKVIDNHPEYTIHDCSKMHYEKRYLMPELLGYSFEQEE